MAATLSCPELLELLRRHALLEPAQVDELARLTTPGSTPQTLGKLILDRDWLTSFQVNRILTGKAEELFLGQYLLQAKLGEGGMGQVYRALDRTMGRVVALKLIRPDVLNNEQAVERFKKEIRAAADLDHPNIIRAYHAGCIGNAHFLIMEYAEGTDLHRRVREGHPLPVASVCEWGRQTALALEYLGERRMVHRDIKPMNLLLTVKGVIKLLDMGLARRHTLAAPAEGGQATRQGSMMGTPDYVAPEQIVDASSVDIRADVYSLGCTLHHLLAGSPPFPGNDLRDKLRRQLGDQPPPLEHLRPDVPAALADLVRWMMRKEPAQRPQTPGEVAAALEKFTGREAAGLAAPASIPPSIAHSLPETTDFVKSSAAGRRTKWLIAAGIAAAALLFLAVWNPFAGTDKTEEPQPKPDAENGQARLDKKTPPDDPPKKKDDPPPKDPPDEPKKDPPDEPKKDPPLPIPPRELPPWKGRLPWQPAELEQVIGDERGRHWGPVSLVVWSGDGRRLASAGDDGVRIWDAATLREAGVLNLNIRATAMALSPDGKRLVTVSYSDDGQVWDLAGAKPSKGPLKMVQSLRGNSITALEFSPDGKDLTGLTSRGGMVRWPAKGLEEPPEEVIPPDESLISRMQSLNRKGTRLARLDRDLTRTRVLLRSTAEADGKEKEVAEFLGQGRSLALSPDGRILAATVGPDHKQTMHSSSALRLWDVSKEPARELGKHIREAGGMGLLAFSDDGKWLAGAAGTSILVWRIGEAGPAPPVELKGHTGVLNSLAFSPSGNVLASASFDGSVRLWDVSKPAPASDPAGWKAYALAFSPDGKRLASGLRILPTRTSTDVNSLVRVQSLGDPGSMRQAEFEGFLQSVSFSPDGSRLLVAGTVASHRKNKLSSWGVMEVRDAGTLEILKELAFAEENIQAHFHDDGKRCTILAIRNPQSEGSRVAFRLFDTSAWKELGNGYRSTPFGAVSSDGKLGMTRETGNEPGVGKTEEAVVWDLSRLAESALPEKKRFTLGIWPGSWDLIQAFSPDGKRLAIAGAARQVELWDPLTGRRVGSTKTNYARVSSLAFSRDSSLMATVEEGARIAVWRTDVAELKPYREPWTFPGAVQTIAFDRLGHLLALANANGTVYLLRVRAAAP